MHEKAEWRVDVDGWYLYCSNCKTELKQKMPLKICPNCEEKMHSEVDGKPY